MQSENGALAKEWVVEMITVDKKANMHLMQGN